MVNKIGRSVLAGTSNALLVSLGIGILTGEATVKKSKDLAETGSLKAMYAVDKAKDLAETGALYAMSAADKVADGAKDLVETGALYAMSAADKAKDLAETGALQAMYAVDSGIDLAKETVESIRATLEKHAVAAESRRKARRERWSALKTSAIGLGREIVDSSKEKGREALDRAHAARAAGSAALVAATTTYNARLEQNRL